MFDRNPKNGFVVPILSGGEKRCAVRFPTDEEWKERTRKRQAVRRIVGRGKTEYDVPNAEGPDAELFAKILLDAFGNEFDAAEASQVIARIERCRVTNVERDGDRYRIEMAVPGMGVVHVLRIPMKADTLRYGRTSVRSTEGRGVQHIRLSLEPSAELWAKVLVEVHGYENADDIPIIHKDVAVVELLAQVELAEEEGDDPEI